MKGNGFYFCCLMLLANTTFAQRMHLEVGGTVGFKDEFFQHPTFSLGAEFAEFHIFDISLLARVSKRRLGLEMDLGFEKSSDYFVRFDATSKTTNYMNLNRVLSDVSGLIYLKKSAKHKVDVQLGCRNYFNCTPDLNLTETYALRTWKCAARLGLNYTCKSFLCGVYYEQALRNDYSFGNPTAVFGIRLGVIY